MKTKMKMRSLSLLLCFVMLVGFMPTTGFVTQAYAEPTEGSYAINITNHSTSSFELGRDVVSGVYDLWKEIDPDETGDELRFHHSFSVNINDAIDVYNSKQANAKFKASKDINNNATFMVEVLICIGDYRFSSSAYYNLHPENLSGDQNSSYEKWTRSSDDYLSSAFFTMSTNNNVLNFSINGTVREIYEALKEQNDWPGDPTVQSISLSVGASCQVEYVDWYVKTNKTVFESTTYILNDAHIYESATEEPILSAITTVSPITALVAPAYEGCYEPAQAEYNWTYSFAKEGYDPEDDNWYGYFEKDESKESDVLTVIGPSGTIFGIAYGTVNSGGRNYITLSDILNDENKAFVNSFIGAGSMELGGQGQISIECTVTLTFADGKQYEICITKADFMTKLIYPCMHACTVCGYCTVTDEALPCNFDLMMYEFFNTCICDEPSVPSFEITVKSQEELVIESTETAVSVVVEQIEVEETPTHSFIVNSTNAVGANNVMALYNINIFNEEGLPYTLNQWGDMGEKLTVRVPISMEEAQALQSGEAVLYHILSNGTAEEIEDVTIEIEGETATMIFTSDSFSPYIVARKSTEVPAVSARIDGVSLRPGSAGLYYNGTFTIDDSVAVQRYGITLSLSNQLPVADGTDDTCMWTDGMNSVLVSNILVRELSPEDNAARALAPVYARAYVLLEDGTYIYSEPVSMYLQELVERIDLQFGSLTQVQTKAVGELYAAYRETMDLWEIPNMKRSFSK